MRLHLSSKWLHRAVCLGGLFIAGCEVSPQPEPPAIFANLLSIEAGADGSSVTLVGAPGAVTPGGSTLATLDLDTTAPVTSLHVAADGSFSRMLGGGLMDAYRLQAFSNGESSDPLDVAGHSGLMGSTDLTPVTRPLASCFSLTPDLEIGPIAAGSSATVVLGNGCASAVTIGAITLRAGSPAFTLAPTGSFVVPAKSTGSFTVGFSPHAGDSTEDIVFVRVDAPESGRFPLTVRGKVP